MNLLAWQNGMTEIALRDCHEAAMFPGKDVCWAAAAARHQSRPYEWSTACCINNHNTTKNNSTNLLAMRPWFGTNTDRDVPENVFLLSLVFVHFSDKPTNLHFHPGTSVPNHSLANKSFIFIIERSQSTNSHTHRRKYQKWIIILFHFLNKEMN